MFISNGGEAFARMVNRSAISRARVVEFQEATEEEAFEFLENQLGEMKYNEKKNELVDLVKNYTGGKFKTLVDVAKGVDDLEGISSGLLTLFLLLLLLLLFLGKMRQLREEAEKHLQTFSMHTPKEELEKTVKDESLLIGGRMKAKKALVMKDIGNHIVKNGNIDRGLLMRKILVTMGEEELRRTNIFAYHHLTNSYSFATRALKTVYQVVYLTLVSVLLIYITVA